MCNKSSSFNIHSQRNSKGETTWASLWGTIEAMCNKKSSFDIHFPLEARIHLRECG